ncbi:MAG: tetratricopeptide repeat protein, partial [Planctomycetota bacterium]
MLLLLAACAGGDAEGPARDESKDFEDLLSVAREMMDLGLPDVALKECRYIAENTDPSASGLIAEALYMAGDCELEQGHTDRAMEKYREVGQRFPHEKGKASRKEAEAFLSKGRWEEALAVLDDVDSSGLPEGERAKLSELIANIRPVTQMRVKAAGNYSSYVDAVKDADHRLVDWYVKSPMHFRMIRSSTEDRHGRIRMLIQKETGGGLWHALPWRGSSFRLAARFRIDSVDRREHQISASFGIGNRKYFDDRQRAVESDADKLRVKILAKTLVEGEHRSRDLLFRRERAFDRGTRVSSKGAVLLADAPLDTWFLVRIEYSRELGSIRVRLVKSKAGGTDDLLSDQVLNDVAPFGKGPFFLYLGEEIGGGDK